MLSASAPVGMFSTKPLPAPRESPTLTPIACDAANTAHYFTMVNMESQHSGDKGLYSGINSLGKVVQYNGSYENTPSECTVDFFADFTTEMLLDMNSTQTWAVAN